MERAIDTLETWGDSLLDHLPNITAALAMVLVSVLIGKLIRRSVQRVAKRSNGSHAAVQLLSTLAYILSIGIGLIIALNILELDGAATSVLAGAGVVGIALGFALQDIAANFISGIIIAFQKPMRVGDLVETNDFYGTVKKITLRMTQIQTLQGQMVYIPNKDIILNPLVEYNSQKLRRIDLTCGVRYDDDLELARSSAIAAVKKLKTTDATQPVDLFFTEYGDSSINFVIRFWTLFKNEPDFLEAQSEAIIAIQKAFAKDGITIPFPIRTLEGTVSLKR